MVEQVDGGGGVGVGCGIYRNNNYVLGGVFQILMLARKCIMLLSSCGYLLLLGDIFCSLCLIMLLLFRVP